VDGLLQALIRGVLPPPASDGWGLDYGDDGDLLLPEPEELEELLAADGLGEGGAPAAVGRMDDLRMLDGLRSGLQAGFRAADVAQRCSAAFRAGGGGQVGGWARLEAELGLAHRRLSAAVARWRRVDAQVEAWVKAAKEGVAEAGGSAPAVAAVAAAATNGIPAAAAQRPRQAAWPAESLSLAVRLPPALEAELAAALADVDDLLPPLQAAAARDADAAAAAHPARGEGGAWAFAAALPLRRRLARAAAALTPPDALPCAPDEVRREAGTGTGHPRTHLIAPALLPPTVLAALAGVRAALEEALEGLPPAPPGSAVAVGAPLPVAGGGGPASGAATAALRARTALFRALRFGVVPAFVRSGQPALRRRAALWSDAVATAELRAAAVGADAGMATAGPPPVAGLRALEGAAAAATGHAPHAPALPYAAVAAAAAAVAQDLSSSIRIAPGAVVALQAAAEAHIVGAMAAAAARARARGVRLYRARGVAVVGPHGPLAEPAVGPSDLLAVLPPREAAAVAAAKYR